MLAASLHYFRLPPASFGPALRSFRSIGFDTVESPVPWGVHESPGGFAFDRDAAHLVAMLEEASRAGLGVHLRLGPCVGAGLTYFGLPRSVAADAGLAARQPSGAPQVLPIPPRWMYVPSYASRAYRDRAAEWIAAACAVLRPFADASGPLRSVSIGDVRPFLGRAAHVPGDHHPDALVAWDVERSGADQAERERLTPRVRPAAFDPGRESAVPAALGAARFAERSYLSFLDVLAVAVSDGLGVPAATSVPPAGLFPPVGAGLLACSFERLGLDVFGAGGLRRPLERGLRLLSATARRPFASLVSAGTPLYLPQLDAGDNLVGLRAALGAGLEGIVVSAGVAHDRWVGGLLDEHLREAVDLAAPVRRLFHGVVRSGWLGLKGRPAAVIVLPRAYVRCALAAASAVLGPVGGDVVSALGHSPTAALEPNGAGPAGGAWWRWFEAAESALEEAGIAHGIIDDEGPLEVDPVATPLLMAPTLDLAPPSAVSRMRRHVERGGVVVAGPWVPGRDLLTGEPFAPAVDGIRVVPEPDAETVRSVVQAAGFPVPAPGGRFEAIERSFLRDPADGSGVIRALVVTNRSRGAVPIATASGDGAWRDLDEPGTAPAKGTLEAGRTRLLVPASGGRERP